MSLEDAVNDRRAFLNAESKMAADVATQKAREESAALDELHSLINQAFKILSEHNVERALSVDFGFTRSFFKGNQRFKMTILDSGIALGKGATYAIKDGWHHVGDLEPKAPRD